MVPTERSWILPTVLLCTNGFLRSFNPADSYVTPYLMSPPKNFTSSELVNQIYPVWVYSYICFIVPVFLLTDFLKYKPVIILGGISYVGCWLFLLFGQNVITMQIMQVLYGMAKAGDIGYYSYVYSIVPEAKYRQVTSYTRSVVLLGGFAGAVLAQVLVSALSIDYFYLNVITFVNICLGLFVSLFLPMPKKTLFFYAMPKSTESRAELSPGHASDDVKSESLAVEKEKVSSKWIAVLLSLGKDLKSVFVNPVLFRWSVWWVLSTCGYLLIINYVQNLWETVHPSQLNHSKVYNGAAAALATILGAVGSFSVGYINLSWSRWGEITLGSCSVLKSVMLSLMYQTKSIWTCYATYVAYIFLHNFTKTITQFQLAIGLNNERYALVFGLNSFLAVVLNTVITLVVIDDVGLGLGVRIQFLIYGIYFGVLSLVFLSRGIYSLMLSGCKLQAQDITVEVNGTEEIG